MLLQSTAQFRHCHIILLGNAAFTDNGFVTQCPAAALIPGVDFTGTNIARNICQPMYPFGIGAFLAPLYSIFHFHSVGDMVNPNVIFRSDNRYFSISSGPQDADPMPETL